MKPPIAEPRGTPRINEDESAFRVNFWRYFLATAFIPFFIEVPIAGAILFPLPVFTRHPENFPQAMAQFSFASLIFVLTICILNYYLATIKVDKRMVRAFNFWGLRRGETEWTRIVTAQHKWFMLPYVVISTATKQKLWIPLWLEDIEGFARAVADNTAPDHPLHAFFARRGTLTTPKTRSEGQKVEL